MFQTLYTGLVINRANSSRIRWNFFDCTTARINRDRCVLHLFPGGSFLPNCISSSLTMTDECTHQRESPVITNPILKESLERSIFISRVVISRIPRNSFDDSYRTTINITTEMSAKCFGKQNAYPIVNECISDVIDEYLSLHRYTELYMNRLVNLCLGFVASSIARKLDVIQDCVRSASGSI